MTDVIECCREEQDMEIEAMQHIFESQIEVVDQSNLILRLVPDCNDKMYLEVKVFYPPEYPLNAQAELKVSEHRRVSSSFVEQMEMLIDERVVENADFGCTYVFAILQEILDAFFELATASNGSTYDEMMREEAMNAQLEQKEEVEEKPEEDIFEHGMLPGEPVTDAIFKRWWDQFVKEQNIDVSLEPVHAGKTGKQIFEEGDAEDEDEAA
ncbi:RWD domain [Carpediemonas membranifera]|uniref:RWD domain n=1 Tax=Carpediemonas membranifera TaxID=201153 RepID=A0A8J6E744_9EUKA|nr:RWD domain [Carpediemonas membranifera]|eukprot:KAG9390280.1 RWD domain [Carpediemonas membranifera]